MKSVIGIIILFIGVISLFNYAPSSNANGGVVALLVIISIFGFDTALSGLIE